MPNSCNSWSILCPDPFWKTKEYNPNQGFQAPEMSGFHWNRPLARGNLNLTWIYSYIYTLMGILAETIAEAEGKEFCRFRSETYRRDCKWSCWIFFPYSSRSFPMGSGRKHGGKIQRIPARNTASMNTPE